MAISAVLFFESTGDVRKAYDAVIDEMGVRDNPPPGLIYHWCAPTRGGLQICDIWETREQFDRFADEKIGPLAAKHGLGAPELDITDVHEFIPGKTTSHEGCGLLVDFDGDTEALFNSIDDANERMGAPSNPPDGLIMHWTMPSAHGIRIVDHWQSREDFERFVETRLMPVMEPVGLPQPKISEFDVYNTIDRRVVASV